MRIRLLAQAFRLYLKTAFHLYLGKATYQLLATRMNRRNYLKSNFEVAAIQLHSQRFQCKCFSRLMQSRFRSQGAQLLGKQKEQPTLPPTNKRGN